MKIRVVATPVGVFSEPDVRSQILLTLPTGEERELTKRFQHNREDWLEIQMGTRVGYIQANGQVEVISGMPALDAAEVATQLTSDRPSPPTQHIPPCDRRDVEWSNSAAIAFGVFALAVALPVSFLTGVGQKVVASTGSRLAISLFVALGFALLGRKLAFGPGARKVAIQVLLLGDEHGMEMIAALSTARQLNRYVPIAGFIIGFVLGAM